MYKNADTGKNLYNWIPTVSSQQGNRVHRTDGFIWISPVSGRGLAQYGMSALLLFWQRLMSSGVICMTLSQSHVYIDGEEEKKKKKPIENNGPYGYSLLLLNTLYFFEADLWHPVVSSLHVFCNCFSGTALCCGELCLRKWGQNHKLINLKSNVCLYKEVEFGFLRNIVPSC